MVHVLHMETDTVRHVAGQLLTRFEEAQTILDGIVHAIENMNWASPARDQYVDDYRSLHELFTQFFASGMEFGQRLKREVLEWEECAASLAGGNATTPTVESLAGLNDARSPVKKWLGDNTPLAFVPGFTPPVGGDVETVDDRLSARFGRDVNLVDGNRVWADYEVAAVDRAVANLPETLIRRSLLKNIYRDERDGDAAAYWLPPGYSGDRAHDPCTITFQTPLVVARQGSNDGGQRVEVVMYHELVHSAQYEPDGQMNDLTLEYIKQFDWTYQNGEWSYNGPSGEFPGSSESLLGLLPLAYPEEGRTGREDMAEAITYYRYEPETLRKESPERYEWVKTHIFNGEEF